MAEEKYVSREEAEAAPARAARAAPASRPARRSPRTSWRRCASTSSGVRQPAHLPGRACASTRRSTRGCSGRRCGRCATGCARSTAGPGASCKPTDEPPRGRAPARSAAPRRVGLALRGGRRGARRGDRLRPRDGGGAGRRLSRPARPRRTSPGRAGPACPTSCPGARWRPSGSCRSPRTDGRKEAQVAARAGAEGGGGARWPWTCGRGRCGPWSAATTSSGASSTGRPRRCARWAPRSSPSSTPPPSRRWAGRPRRSSWTRPLSFTEPLGQDGLVPAELRRRLPGSDPPAARGRAEPQRPRGEDAAGGGDRQRHRVRPPAGALRRAAALPARSPSGPARPRSSRWWPPSPPSPTRGCG